MYFQGKDMILIDIFDSSKHEEHSLLCYSKKPLHLPCVQIS